MSGALRIPPSVAERLGEYVYLYVNPLDNSVFYVGKGKNGRALSHLSADRKRKIAGVIRRIRKSGGEPRIEILAHNLPDHDTARMIEAAAINLIGLPNLANSVSGWQHTKLGRMAIGEIVAGYSQAKAVIREPAILLRINQNYRHGMSDVELYDATRAYWNVGDETRDEAELAFAVYQQTIREVYRITDWHPGGTTFNVRNVGRETDAGSKWEFVGTIAEPELRDRYINRSVAHLMKGHAQNPVRVVNIQDAQRRGSKASRRRSRRR